MTYIVYRALMLWAATLPAFVPAMLGCARPALDARRMPAWVFESSHGGAIRTGARRTPRPRDGGIRGRNEASDFVVAALQETGLRFGTDGSVASLWGYMRTAHRTVPVTATQVGDVLFFQTRAPLREPGLLNGRDRCESPDHVAIVSALDPDRRVAFVEVRNGQVRRSYVEPSRPRLRRDDDGRVLNTFLRPKRSGDPADGPILAGEMLCGVARPKS